MNIFYMKKLIAKAIAVLALGFVFSCMGTTSASAQIPGAIISAGGLAGLQGSSQSGIGGGSYLAARGSFSSLFGEIREANWGNSSAYIHETGILGGTDFSIWHLMFAGAVGVGQSAYQAPAVSGIMPAVQNYTSFIYEAQAMYQFDIISGMMSLGVGVNYIGESNSVAPISGWGGVASLNIGL